MKNIMNAATSAPAGDILMISSTHIKTPADVCRARGDSQDVDRKKGGLNSKLHLVVDEYEIPASGSVADCSQVSRLMERLDAEVFLCIQGVQHKYANKNA